MEKWFINGIETEIYWDDADPNDVGWAYRLIWRDSDGRVIREESGPLYGPDFLSEIRAIVELEYGQDVAM